MDGEKPTSKALQLAWQGTQRPADSIQKHDRCKIAAIGVGGTGCNIIAHLAKSGVKNTQTVAIGSNPLRLEATQADHRILISGKPHQGEGASEHSVLDETAAAETREQVKQILAKVDIVIITAGLGDETGTETATIVAETANRKGALTIGVVAKPLRNGRGRTRRSCQAITKLRRNSDTLITIDSNKLLETEPQLSIDEASKIVDKMVAQTIRSLVEAISASNLENPDIDDYKTILKQGGVALVGIGESDAPNRAEEAVRNALSSPLMHTDYTNATGALVHVSGDVKMTTEEASHVGEIVTKMMSSGAQVIWGAQVNPELNGRLRVTLLMTGTNPPQSPRRIGTLAPHLFNLETTWKPEKRLAVDLGLYQMEDF